jgi:outer membrane receptor protein involved in Fe transport
MHFSKPRGALALLPAIFVAVGAMQWAKAEDQTPLPDETGTPAVEIVGHYETGIGTSDAASAGSVTATRIDSVPQLRPGEVIQLVPGMAVTQHSGDGKANQYFLRGYNLDHGTDFAIWVDGMPVNMPTHGHGQGYADINFMIPELIQGMDFVKGPYYAAEGDFSTAGAAHIRYFDVLPGNIASVSVGTDNYLRAMAAMSPRVGSGNLLIAAEAKGYDGPWVVPEDLNAYKGVLRYSQGTQAEGFSVGLQAYKAYWDSTDQIPQYAVEAGYIPRFGAIDATDGGQTERYSLNFSGRTTRGAGQAALDAYIIHYKLDLWSNFTYFLDNPVQGDQFQQSDQRTVYGLIPSYAWSHKLAGIDTTNTIGLQARYDDISNVALYSTQARQIYDTTREDSVKQLSVGLFAQNAAQWNSWFRTLLGLRYDQYYFDVDSSIPENSGNVDSGIWSPKASLIFGPWAKTEYFVNAGYGFHSNDARGTTITVDPKDPLTPTSPVDPLVRTKGAELGVRTEIIRGLQTSLALWMLEQDSELLFVGDAGTTEPSRPSRRQGIEWINYYRPLPWLFIDAEIALTKARFTDEDSAGDYIPGAPDAVASLAVTVDNIHNWFGTVQVRYIGERPLIEDDSVRADSSTITNLRIGYAFTPKVRLQLDVFNVFDVATDDIAYYYESFIPGVIPGPQQDIHFHPAEPRQFRLTLVANF